MFFRMRKYKRKSNRGSVSLETMKKAAKLVRKKCLNIRAAADLYGICSMSLNRFIKRLDSSPRPTILLGYVCNRLVFTAPQEEALVALLKERSATHPITSWEIRILALQFATNHNIKVPPSWQSKCLAGEDWLSGFYKRNDHLLVEFIPLRRNRYLNRLKREGCNLRDSQSNFKQIKGPLKSERMFYVYVDDQNETLNLNKSENLISEENCEKNLASSPVLQIKLEPKEEIVSESVQNNVPSVDNPATKENMVNSIDDDARDIHSAAFKESKIISFLDKAVSFYSINNREEVTSDKSVNVFVYRPRTHLLLFVKTVDIDVKDTSGGYHQ